MLPQDVNGRWKITRTADVPLEGTPMVVRELGYKRGMRAHYEGETSFAVTLYEMTTQPGAFELLQKWRSLEGKMYFQQGQRFILIEALGEENQQLKEFTDALEKAMPQG